MKLSRFTKNKQTVRILQAESINKYLAKRLGTLKYFGLPSDEMGDIICWKNFFSEFTVVERGVPPDCWEIQHSLIVTAFKIDVLHKTILLRGDIDKIILDGEDEYGNIIEYPFDLITLDYSGGLLYRNSKNEQNRLNAIRKLIEMQSKYKRDYLLFISTNLDNCKDGEIKNTLENMRTELLRASYNAKEVINAYLDHERDEVRLKIYIPYFINQVAASQNYNCNTEKVIFYLGNNSILMMNFRFYLKYDPRTTAPRSPKERLSQIINAPMIEIKDGKCKETSLGLPKLRRQSNNE